MQDCKPILITFICLLVVSLSIRALLAPANPIYPHGGPDEVRYHRYARILANRGLLGIQDYQKKFIQNKIEVLFPNPLRIGFPLAGTFFMWLFNYQAHESLLFVSYLSGIFIVLLSFLIFKPLNFQVAVATSLLVLTSPLACHFSYRSMSDIFVCLLLIVVLLLFYLALKQESLLTSLLLFIFLFWAFLTRESSVLVLLPLIFLFLYFYKNKLLSRLWFLYSILPVMLAVAAYAIYLICMLGGYQKVVEYYLYLLNTIQASNYQKVHQSGPWYRYVVDFILLSPVVSIVGFFAILVSLLKFIPLVDKRLNMLLIYSVVIFISMSFFTVLNVRLVVVFDILIRFFASYIIYYCLFTKWQVKHPRCLFILLLIALMSYDIYQFKLLFDGNIFDPVTHKLLDASWLE